ncbi:MAG: WYL domain-containing protein [Bacteroidales bacterium]|nr:WYL domain-containing protein [Bacteroidales bacterium]MBR6863255.1 WYL domain-containing protein [Bacteroidales bacterium]
MATNNHASIRYETLDHYLQRDSVENTCENLRRWCCDAVNRYDPDYEYSEVSVRTFRKDIKHLKDKIVEMKLMDDVSIMIKVGEIRGEKHYYYTYSKPGFSIYRNELSNEEVGQLEGAMKLLAKFKGMPEYDKIAELGNKLRKRFKIESSSDAYIEYEHIDSTGEESLSDICNCIITKRPIRLTYTPYGKEEKEWLIHPYYLKEYNNRWFLFGYNETLDKISNVALDRIRADFEPSNQPFIPNTFVDFSTFFDNVVGVTVRNAPVEHIVFKATKNRFPYIESKPIHPTQETIDAEEGTFSIDVIPNLELDALVLSFTGDLEVLSPEDYRERISSIIKSSLEKYYRCEG